MVKKTKTHNEEGKKKNVPKNKIIKAKHRMNKGVLENKGALQSHPVVKLFRESSGLETKEFNMKEKLSCVKGTKKSKSEKLRAKVNRKVAWKENRSKNVRSKTKETDRGPNVIPENVKTLLQPDPVPEKKLKKSSDFPITKKADWSNRNRVLIFACRGISKRDRHLMQDIITMLPHARTESKMERRKDLVVVNEICEMRNCNKCVLFEGRGGRDVYMWLSILPTGPSAKFLLHNVYTMDELHFTGNCLIGSRPLLSFDETFETSLQYKLFKEFLIQTFGTPHRHPKSQPFYDHVFTFSIVDKRIWFRNYQILSEDGALSEIGPRFVMNPVRIFEGSFCGDTLWENPHYVTPASGRKVANARKAGTYVQRQQKKERLEKKRKRLSYKVGATDEIFTENPWEKAEELVESMEKENWKIN